MEIRIARAEDALDVETVRLRSWKAAYRGIVSDAFLDAMVVDVARRTRMIGTVTTLLARDPAPVGMAAFGPTRDDGVSGLELYAMYVDPSAWRGGIGSALLAACPGVSVLWVLEANARARAFYGRHGFVPDGASKVLDLGGPVTEIRMARPQT